MEGGWVVSQFMWNATHIDMHIQLYTITNKIYGILTNKIYGILT